MKFPVNYELKPGITVGITGATEEEVALSFTNSWLTAAAMCFVPELIKERSEEISAMTEITKIFKIPPHTRTGVIEETEEFLRKREEVVELWKKKNKKA